MESLAYLHLALAYETPADSSCALGLLNLKLLVKLNQQKLVSRAGIYFLSLAVSLAVLGMVSEALAAALQEGSTGAEVTRVQKRLQNLGYFNAGVTGNFGSQTRDAVIQFQQAKGLTPDGVVGNDTKAALFGQGSRRRTESYNGVSDTPNVNAESGVSSWQQAQSNEDVRYLQQQLRDKGFYFGPIDGVYGSQTQQAVRDFQAKVGLPVDGIAGTRTRIALDSYQGRGSIGEEYPGGSYGEQPSKRNYVVVVPGNYDTLSRVSLYADNAILEKSRLGSYVNAGAFSNRARAESLSERLRSRRLDARVVYRP